MTQPLPLDGRGYFKRVPRCVDIIVVVALGMFVNSYIVGRGPLAGTEGHRALTAHQMVTSGQWLIPKLYDQYYLRKPPLDYWILASLEVMTGRTDTWIWRIPSAVEAALLGAFFCVITGRWFGRLAGFVAGISMCGMVAVWGQNRTAEVDSLNSLACAACACWLIDLGYGDSKHRARITLLAGLAFGAAMMTKGPAGLAVILAALVGPAIFNRDWSPLKKPGWWIALLIGTAVFVVYAIAVWARFRSLHETPDTSGLGEVRYNFFEERLKNLLGIIRLPLYMLIYLMPMSLALLPAFKNRAWVGSLWSEKDRQLLNALLGTLVASCGLTMLFGLAHERYSYVWAPMICPIVGAVAAAWERDVLTPWQRKHAPTLLAISVGTFALGCAGITGIFFLRTNVIGWVPIGLVAIAMCIAGWAISQISRGRVVRAAWAIVPLIALAAPPYALLMVPNREHLSTYPSAVSLRGKLPAGTKVIAGNLLMDQPELFFYSGMAVKSYGNDELYLTFDLPGDCWVVLDDREFTKNQFDPRLKNPIRLSPERPAVILAWYEKNAAATRAVSTTQSK